MWWQDNNYSFSQMTKIIRTFSVSTIWTDLMKIHRLRNPALERKESHPTNWIISTCHFIDARMSVLIAIVFAEKQTY